MDEAINLLREQAILCNRLLTAFSELSDLLRKNSPNIAEAITQIEIVVNELRNNLIRTQAFLGKFSVKNFAEFLNLQENSVERDIAHRLLTQIETIQPQLKHHTNIVNRLMISGRKFVEFNINVISQAATNTTYGSAAQTGTSNNRRIFDANV